MHRQGPQRSKRGEGPFRAPRTTLQPGAVTRREWLLFLQHVSIGDACACTDVEHVHWIWHGSLNGHMGYGRLRWRGRHYYAHRFACIALGKTIPDDLVIDHLCRISQCVNPQCFELVTNKVNALRGNGVGAQHARKDTCLNGHPLTEDNLCAWEKGRRRCVQCNRESSRLRTARYRERLRLQQEGV